MDAHQEKKYALIIHKNVNIKNFRDAIFKMRLIKAQISVEYNICGI